MPSAHHSMPSRRQRRPVAKPWVCVLVLALFAACTPSGGGPAAGHSTSGTASPFVPAHQLAYDVTCPGFDPSKSPLPADLPAVQAESAGAIAGAFSVSHGGEATYTMPLAVPPGRAGMEPRLSVTYSSGSDQGILGMGFSLQGISAIARCPSNIAQDGAIRPVRYDVLDHLCLDGSRLVAVGAKTGVVPQVGPTMLEYRTFPDTFAKVVAHFPAGWDREKGPQFFEVFTRAGRILEYGATASGQELAKNGIVAAWWLTREKDRRGNAINYSYHNDTDPAEGYTVEHYPDRIDYTSHPSAPASSAVIFGYESAITPNTVFRGGMALVQSKQLSQIDMVTEPGDARVRMYQFWYNESPGTGRSLLQTVVECPATGPCKPRTDFTWNGHPGGGFTKVITPVMYPQSVAHVHRAQWLLADVNGDGLDDLVISLPDPSDHDVNAWTVALSDGKSFGAPSVWAKFPYPLGLDEYEYHDQLWTPTPIDYDHDGLTDILLDEQNLSGKVWPRYRWLHALPNHKFELLETEIPHPAQVDDSAVKLAPILHRFARLGDVNGDGVADLIQCVNKAWEDNAPSDALPEWTVHLWSPSRPDGHPGFDPKPIPIPNLEGLDCQAGVKEIYVVDIDGDGTAELLAPIAPSCANCDETYGAFQFTHGWWSSVDTRLPLQISWRKIHFLDLNADGLPDALYTGMGCNDRSLSEHACVGASPSQGPPWPADVPLKAMNTGVAFTGIAPTLAASIAGTDNWTDWYGDESMSIDYDGDGQMDLLLLVPGHCGPGADPASSCWVVLRSNPSISAPQSVIDTHIPWVSFAYDVVPQWYLPQVTDVNGDGRHDVVVPSMDDDGTFTVYRNDGPQDLLVSVTDGLNPLEETDPGFLPTVGIEYGSLVDLATTQGLPAGSSKREAMTYLPRSDAANDCDYPRACVVGPRRVVSRYTLNDGANEPRAFEVKYRDGRYHYLGRGSLGFGARIVVDQDTKAGTAEFFDNITHDPVLDTYPFAGQVVRSWAWAPGLPGQPDPSQIELTYSAATLQTVTTNQGKTYFTLPVVTRVQHEEGHFLAKPKDTVFDYVQATEGSPTTMLRDSWRVVSDYDEYGDVLAEVEQTAGVDLVTKVKRTYESDPGTWLVGLPSSEEVCSAALGTTQCRTTSLEHNPFGEVWSATIGDPTDPETQLSLHYAHDAYGHVIFTAADDAFGHHRSSCTSYDQEGVFPYAMGNGAGHISYAKFDRGLGVQTASVDANGLVTQWRHDGFGRVTEEDRPDGTSTTVSRARHKDGGPLGTWFAVKSHTTSTGGGEEIVEHDGLGRAVRSWTRGPDVPACDASTCDAAPWFEQEVAFDHLGRVARTSLPWLASDTAATPLYQAFDHDAVGRVTRHTMPWGSKTNYAYDGNTASVTDSAGTAHATVDPLGRPVGVTDKAGHVTHYTYGAFGGVVRVDLPGGHATTMTRDAYGRVRTHVDPDRGESNTDYDGFGEPTFTVDALGRAHAFGYDALGRIVRRDDPDGITTWEHDTAPHGKGLIASVISPAGHTRTFTYDDLSRPYTVTLALGDTGETFESTFSYDTSGRLSKIAYPQGDGVAPLVVRRDYDSTGNVVAIHDDTSTGPALWRLDKVDEAGRPTLETFANGFATRRWFDPKKGTVLRILTGLQGNGTVPLPPVQDLRYTYDDRLNVTSRQDWLQISTAGVATERFDNDALDRLTCAWFTTTPTGSGLVYQPGGGAAACTPQIQYAANGNIAFKSDVGHYAYDPKHPHAVKTAGSGSYGHDAVGNQIARPGATIEYTAFDLPKVITRTADSAAFRFDYDGDQQRIRKTSPAEETVYLDGLYERVTDAATGGVKHRYYVAAGSATLAITRVAGAPDELAYVHPDALGSVDVVTDGKGAVADRRSYDAFGARRNPQWGQAPGTQPAPRVNMGFTGHEPDDELGLVNMKGRIYDPRLGRFLMTDPIVSNPLFSQSWNPYSYVLNNPLALVDPSGFEEMPGECGGQCRKFDGDSRWFKQQLMKVGTTPSGGPHELQVWVPVQEKTPSQHRDMARDDGPPSVQPTSRVVDHPLVQQEAGFLAGVGCGLVPGCAAAHQGAVETKMIEPSDSWRTRLATSVGEMMGGAVLATGGVAGEWFGGAVTATGVGALVGVPAIVVSTTAVVGGGANVLAGSRGAVQALMSRGSGSGGGKTARKVNPDRVNAAKERLERLKQEFKTLDSKANKGPEDNQHLEKLERAISKAKDDMKKSENHAQKGQGYR